MSDWAVQFLSIRSIEWLGLKKLHTVQYPRYCTGCESATTSPLAPTWMMIFQISLLFPLLSLVRIHLLKSYFSLESQQGISSAAKRQCSSALLIFVLFILFLYLRALGWTLRPRHNSQIWVVGFKTIIMVRSTETANKERQREIKFELEFEFKAAFGLTKSQFRKIILGKIFL